MQAFALVPRIDNVYFLMRQSSDCSGSFFLLGKHFPYELNGFFGGQVLAENSQQYSVDVADGLCRRCFHAFISFFLCRNIVYFLLVFAFFIYIFF